MAFSFAEQIEVCCEHCAAQTKALAWRTVDAIERPDLAGQVAHGRLHVWVCSNCQVEGEHDARVLCTRFDEETPILLGVPDGDLLLEDPFVHGRWLMERGQAEFSAAGIHLPSPVLAVPFDILQIVALSDVARDLRESQAVLATIAEADEQVATRYAIFLEMARDSRAERRLSSALQHVSQVTDRDDIEPSRL